MKKISTLKSYRIEKGMTQVEVANKACITERTYQKYENEGQMPTAQIAIRIAKALGTTVEKLWGVNAHSKDNN